MLETIDKVSSIRLEVDTFVPHLDFNLRKVLDFVFTLSSSDIIIRLLYMPY